MIDEVKIFTPRKENFFQNKKIILFLGLGLLINLIVWIFLFLKIKPQSEPVYLHYNIYFGVDLIGEWYKIFLMPFIGLVIYFINLYLSYIIYKREKIISYIIIGITIFLECVILVASLLIARQNI